MKTSRRLLARYAVDELNKGTKKADVAKHLAAALIAGKAQAQAELLISDIALELELRGEQSNVVVTTASSLSDELRSEISSLVRAKTKVNSVQINEVIDSSVIGGIRIDSPSKTWDKTVKRELTHLREAF